MPHHDLPAKAWRRFSHCPHISCVEVALQPSGPVSVRDSKDPDGPVLVFTPAEWRAFLAGVRNGEFNQA